MTEQNLADRHCVPCKGGTPALDRERIDALMGQLDGWSVREASGHLELFKDLKFRNFVEAVDFVNQQLLHTKLDPRRPDDNIRMSTRFMRSILDATRGRADLALSAYYQGLKPTLEGKILEETKRTYEQAIADWRTHTWSQVLEWPPPAGHGSAAPTSPAAI